MVDRFKNVLRTAHLLAKKKEVKLGYSHVQTILTLRRSGSVSEEIVECGGPYT